MQNVIERVATTRSSEQPSQPTSAAAQETTQQSTQPATTSALRLGRSSRASLASQVAGDQHGQQGQHFLQNLGRDPRLGRGMLSHRSAHILGSEYLAQDIVTLIDVSWFGGEEIVEQSAAAKRSQKALESFETIWLSLRLFLNSPKDGRSESGSATGGLRFRDTKLASDRLETAGLGENIGEFHGKAFH